MDFVLTWNQFGIWSKAGKLNLKVLHGRGVCMNVYQCYLLILLVLPHAELWSSDQNLKLVHPLEIEFGPSFYFRL